ncbi:MAG TPA: alanine--glyoxylate aminotransferase family protein [Desulfobacteraceae bacterium]|nr:alanine--glyoxylate aminotransferase family protein [Desulfobacteraceae bacterium]
MGPGPLDIHPRVYKALASPVIGHMDPAYLDVIERIGELLKGVFGTKNEVTNAVPGTGTSGMEACIANVLEPGDPVLVCVSGYFGDRLRQMAERQQARVSVIETEWGKPVDPRIVEEMITKHPAKVIALVHAETSTGVLQPMEDIAAIAKRSDAMILLDVVTSLGGIALDLDNLGVDIAYGCSQKCVGSPPGLSPVTFSERAMDVVRTRKTPVSNWYLDIELLSRYWGKEKVYHHTSSSTLNYALLEALLLIHEEGIEARCARHIKNHRALVAGIEGLGLTMLVEPPFRLPTLNTIVIPDGVDDAKLRGYLLDRYNLEIGGGLGALKGRIWRVGLMGYSSSAQNVIFFISALSRALAIQGFTTDLSGGLEAAMAVIDDGQMEKERTLRLVRK